MERFHAANFITTSDVSFLLLLEGSPFCSLLECSLKAKAVTGVFLVLLVELLSS
jgi:hypothetical protein